MVSGNQRCLHPQRPCLEYQLALPPPSLYRGMHLNQSPHSQLCLHPLLLLRCTHSQRQHEHRQPPWSNTATLYPPPLRQVQPQRYHTHLYPSLLSHVCVPSRRHLPLLLQDFRLRWAELAGGAAAWVLLVVAPASVPLRHLLLAGGL
jgi:hypothetical protein